MKKSLYFLLATFVALTVAGCSDDKGTEPGGDTLPVATIYTAEAPDGCDPDVTAAYRIVPNEATNKIYVLTEPADAKADFLKANTEANYIEKVVKEGQSYETTADIEIVQEDLVGLYATTVVAEAANGTRLAYEVTFKGVVWMPAGTALLEQNFAYDAEENFYRGHVNVERQTEANIFRVFDAFHQMESTLPSFGANSKLTFTFDDNHICTSFATSSAPFVLINFEDAEGAAWFGYYDPVSFPDYCSVSKSKKDYALVSILMMDNNTGNIYAGGELKLTFTDEWEWYN